MLAAAVLAALVHRQRTGQGQFVDLSSTEVMAALSPYAFLAHTLGAPEVTRDANHHPTMAPHGVYPGSLEHDWLSLAVGTDEEWASLCHLVGRPEWVTEYPDAAARQAAEAQIDAALAKWSSERPARESFALLQAAGIPSAPSFTNADLAGDPHLAARGAWARVPHPTLGDQQLPSGPWLLSDLSWPTYPAAPDMGRDNDYVLSELLGMTGDEVAALGDIFV
jgi:crotonobetainyl-CoA:carnitine CoA-transferase CaiB-like acyl-CoA transferase